MEQQRTAALEAGAVGTEVAQDAETGIPHRGLDHFLHPEEHLLNGSVWVLGFFSVGFCQNDSTDQQLDLNFWILWDSLGLWPYEINSDISIW